MWACSRVAWGEGASGRAPEGCGRAAEWPGQWCHPEKEQRLLGQGSEGCKQDR